jgi:hypothetical protein
MTEVLVITTAEGTRSIRGSVIEPETTVNSEGIRVRSDKTLFIVNTKDIVGLIIRRGIRITRSGTLYEVIIDNTTPTYYNDPNRIELVIPAKMKCS